LRRTICQQYRDTQGVLRVVALEPDLEDLLIERLGQLDSQPLFRLPPQTLEALTQALDVELSLLSTPGYPAVVLCSPPLRAALRQLIAPTCPNAAVLSLAEVTPDTRVELHGRVYQHTIHESRLTATN
jgi:flagellar biosynthesis protein FlhA